MIYTCTIETPLGLLLAAVEEDALIGLWFASQKHYPNDMKTWVSKPDHLLFIQLKNWLEYSVRYYSQTKNSGDPATKDATLNIPDYNLDLLYGASYDIDLTQVACTVDKTTGLVLSGNRIKNLKFNGKVITPTDTFTVAINNYRKNIIACKSIQ